MKEGKRAPRGVFEKVPGSGIWWVRYIDANGRLRREKAGRQSWAIDLYSKRKAEALQGKKLPEKLRRPATSFSELAKDALTYSRSNKRHTRDDVSRMPLLLDWFGTRPAASITPVEIQAKLDTCAEERKWAPSTINHYRSLLSLIYRLGIKHGKVATNPISAVSHKREDNSRVRFLTPEEERRLRDVLAMRYPEHVAEFDLALHTGLRRTDMYERLTWEHVNLDLRFAKIPRSKSDKPHHVRLNKAAVEALRIFLARSDGTGRVVRNAQGETLGGYNHWFWRALREARIDGFHWHDIRHTGASRLMMRGATLRDVQEFLGHSHNSLTTTARYTHLSDEYQMRVVELLDEVTSTTTDTATIERSTREPIHVN